jgi:hypothetical protein
LLIEDAILSKMDSSSKIKLIFSIFSSLVSSLAGADTGICSGVCCFGVSG